MRLLRTESDKLVLGILPQEMRMLRSLFERYPATPPAHPRLKLTRHTKLPDPTDQHLLDEALAEHRAECQQQVGALLADPHRLRRTRAGFELTLGRGDVEWLLQVLNEVRVGSWVRLGAPEKEPPLDADKASHVWGMQLAGYFQAALLDLLE